MITRNVRYALRMVIRLAITNRAVTSKELAETERITHRFTLKLLYYLKNAGILKSLRGRSGGYVLAKDPSKIRLLDIFVAMGSDITIVNCNPSCDLFNSCYAKDFWQCLNSLFKKIFEHTTIAHIMNNRCPEELRVFSLDYEESKHVPSLEK